MTMAAASPRSPVAAALCRLGAVSVLALATACANRAPVDSSRSSGPYVAERPQAHLGRTVAAGYCVDFVKVAAGVPRTSAWRPGGTVRGNADIVPGTAIATFEPDGTYASRTGSHAAIYLAQNDDGIWVYDQWRGQPVHMRLIRFEGGTGAKSGSKSNDGTRFAVIR
jgi:hypothetical protein